MRKAPPNLKEMGTYFALAQVGLEMVVPIGIGLALDYYLGWTPWGVVVGAVLGPIVGITHIVTLLNRQNSNGSSEPPQDKR